MSASNRRIDELKIVSPCSSDWGRMPGDEKKRFCVECNKFVYDFSQMTRRQVEAIVSIHRGRMCARITRRPDGSLLTLETPPVHPVVARRASPVVNATLAAILGLSVPANGLNLDVSAAQLIARSDSEGKDAKTPYSGGEALVGGIVFDPQGAVIPNAAVKLVSDAGAELETKTSSEGEFTFAQVPFGAYIMLVEAEGFYTHVNSNVIVDTPYLISQLRRVADDAPGFAESLIQMIAWVINDEDLKRLTNDYDNVALAAIINRSENDDGSDRQDSTRDQRQDFMTLAAIKRSVMLKDFLKLAEYKTKQ